MHKDHIFWAAVFALCVLSEMLGPIIIDHAIMQHIHAWSQLLRDALGSIITNIIGHIAACMFIHHQRIFSYQYQTSI